MDFQKMFTDSIISMHSPNQMFLPKPFFPTSNPLIVQESEGFFNIQAYDRVTVTFPFFYDLQSLDSYQIIYTLRGQGTLTRNDQEYQLIANTLCFINCQVKHSINMNQSALWEFIYIFINSSSIDPYYKLYTNDSSPIMDLFPSSNIPHLFEKLDNKEYSNPLNQALINSKNISDLLTYMIIEKNHTEPSRKKIPRYILDIKKELESNYQDYYTLDLLEKKYKRSKYQISKDFKQYLNTSPINYLIECRIKVAKKLLFTTDFTITQIGSLIGIENPNHFINLFKKKEGVTPLRYRKQHQ